MTNALGTGAAAGIAIAISGPLQRAWLLRLAEELARQCGSEVLFLDVRTGGRARSVVGLLEAFERRVVGTSDLVRQVRLETVTRERLPPSVQVILDLSAGCSSLDEHPRVVSVRFNGCSDPEAITRDAWRGRPSEIEIWLTQAGQNILLSRAVIGIRDRDLLVRAVDEVLRRALELLVDAVAHLLQGKALSDPAPTSRQVAASASCALMQPAYGYSHKILQQFRKRLLNDEVWCIGFRRRQNWSLPPWPKLDAGSFTFIESPPSRYFADPFLHERDQETYLFFEDYDHATQRASISYVIIDSRGGVSRPAPALSRPYHLSYPFVFSWDGATYMLPETSGNQTVELYVAERFPDRWTHYATLMSGIDANDATLYRSEHDSRWWLFTSVARFGASSWDKLSIYYADELKGPWRPHPRNPVKNDVRSSRPGGALIQSEGRLFRPAQDSSAGYGSGLAFCEITDLTPEEYREEPVARVGCPPWSGYYGLHTYNSSKSYEAVDFKLSRWRQLSG